MKTLIETNHFSMDIADQLTVHGCITHLKDMLDREWNYDEYCNRY